MRERFMRFTYLSNWLTARAWQLTMLPDTPEWHEAERFLIERNQLYRELMDLCEAADGASALEQERRAERRRKRGLPSFVDG